jgi:hypothetical protein
MIRQHYLTQVNRLIVEHKRFKESDFRVLIKDVETKYILEITYSYEPEYQFIASMYLSGDVVQGEVEITVTASPGEIFKREKTENVRPNQLNSHIKAWLTRLINELVSVPIQRQIEEQQREIENILGQLDDVPKEYFSRQEAEDLRFRLEEMEARLTSNLQETVTNQAELKTRVKAISDDMAILKENINVLNKRGWAKSLVTRTFEWVKDPANRKVLKAGAEVAKELLLEAGGPTIKPPTP